MNTKSLSRNICIRAVMDARTFDLMKPLAKLESSIYRPKDVAERARIAQAKREEREANRGLDYGC